MGDVSQNIRGLRLPELTPEGLEGGGGGPNFGQIVIFFENCIEIKESA